MISMLFSAYKFTASLFSISVYSSASKQPVIYPLSRKQDSGSKVNSATVPFYCSLFTIQARVYCSWILFKFPFLPI